MSSILDVLNDNPAIARKYASLAELLSATPTNTELKWLADDAKGVPATTPTAPTAPTAPDVGAVLRDKGGGGGGSTTTAETGGFSLSPGRTTAMSVAAKVAPGPLGFAISAANAALGAKAESQKMDAMSQMTGAQPSDMSRAGALLSGATGVGTHDRSEGLGGYGSAGKGGITGLQDSLDPGVAGPARALSKTAVDNFASTGATAGAGGIGGYGTTGAGATDPGVAGVPGGVTGRFSTDQRSGGGNGTNSGGIGGYGSSGRSGSDPGVAGTPGGVTGRGADSSGGSSGSSSRVICTHFYKRGELDRDLWLADMKWTLEHCSETTVNGYHRWAIPAVKRMRKGDFFGRVLEAALRPIAVHRANEIGHIVGIRTKGDIRGKIVRAILEPVSFMIGCFASKQNVGELA